MNLANLHFHCCLAVTHLLEMNAITKLANNWKSHLAIPSMSMVWGLAHLSNSGFLLMMLSCDNCSDSPPHSLSHHFFLCGSPAWSEHDWLLILCGKFLLAAYELLLSSWQSRIMQLCFLFPCPPNLTISRQNTHFPQSCATHPGHFLHLFLLDTIHQYNCQNTIILLYTSYFWGYTHWFWCFYYFHRYIPIFKKDWNVIILNSPTSFPELAVSDVNDQSFLGKTNIAMRAS